MMKKIISEKREKVQIFFSKSSLKKGTRFGDHKVTKMIKKNGKNIAVQCSCTARVTYHPVVEGKAKWSEVIPAPR